MIVIIALQGTECRFVTQIDFSLSDIDLSRIHIRDIFLVTYTANKRCIYFPKLNVSFYHIPFSIYHMKTILNT